ILAAIDHAQFGHAGDIGQESDAARAVDAPRHRGCDQRAEILFLHRALGFLVAAAVEAVSHRLILQIALAALIADWTIERMIDQQEFHHAVARLFGALALRMDYHAIGNRLGAGRDRFRRLFLLDQAHAAIAGDGEALVVAEMRNLDAELLRRLKHGGVRRNLDLAAVDGEFRHRLLRRHRPRAALGDALFHLGPEMPDQALHRPRRAFAERADRVA